MKEAILSAMKTVENACEVAGVTITQEDNADILALLLDPAPVEKPDMVPMFLAMAGRIGQQATADIKALLEAAEADNKKAISFIRSHGLLDEFREGKPRKKNKNEDAAPVAAKQEPAPEPAEKPATVTVAEEEQEADPHVSQPDEADKEEKGDLFGGTSSALDFLSKEGHSVINVECITAMHVTAKSFASLKPGMKVFSYEAPLMKVMPGGGTVEAPLPEGKTYIVANEAPAERYAVCKDQFVEINEFEPHPDDEDEI